MDSDRDSAPGTRPMNLHPSAVPRWLQVTGAWGLRLIAVGASLWLLIELAVKTRVAVLPVLLALVVATLLEPLVAGLHRLRVPRAISSLFSLLLCLGVIGGVIALVAVNVSSEETAFATMAQEGYGSLVQEAAGLAGVSEHAVEGWVDSQLSRLRSATSSAVGRVLSGLADITTTVTVLALTFVFTWFFLWDGSQQFHRVSGFLPERYRRHARELGSRMWSTVGAYMRGIVVMATADSLLLGIGLWITGIPMVLPLMALMFIGAFVPYVGPIVAGTMAALVGLASGGLTKAGLAVLVAVVVQQVEGNLLAPFIMGRATRLHPAFVLFVVTAGGALAGVVGVFLAVPVSACLVASLLYAREQGAV